jgi:transcriptional regulator with XRE-family HTH domain
MRRMSTEKQPADPTDAPAPDLPLSALGKRIELLRVERQIPKQRLARHAGTSRQQLWRVMTGKSELTSAMRERLALVLGIPPAELDRVPNAVDARRTASARPATEAPAAPASLAAYLGDPRALQRTLATLPAGVEGSRLKRGFLNVLEDLALGAGAADASVLLDLRRRVLDGEL